MLEEIIRKAFGCKKVFLKKPKLISEEKDGTKNYEYFTKQGAEGYEKLTEIIYGLETMGLIADANEIIETLDAIVRQEI